MSYLLLKTSLILQLLTAPLRLVLGINMAMVFTAALSLVGCIIIGFIYGWKLTLVTVFVAMPVIVSAPVTAQKFWGWVLVLVQSPC